MFFNALADHKIPKPSKAFWLCHCLGWGAIAFIGVLIEVLVQLAGKLSGGINTQIELMQTSLEMEYHLDAFLLVVVCRYACITVCCLQLRKYILINKVVASQFGLHWRKILFLSLILSAITQINVLTVSYAYNYFVYGQVSNYVFMLVLVLGTAIGAFMYLFWCLVYVAIKYSTELSEIKRNQLTLEIELKDAKLNTLIAQLNPHFLFNALNNISGLMLESIPKSRAVLSELSDMLRYSLQSDEREYNTLNEELEMVRAFIQLAKIQYEQRLQYTENIDPALLKHQVPPMIIHTLIENAVKHGIDKIINGGKITLTIYQDRKNIIIETSNPGSLSKQQAPQNNPNTGLGIQNINKRLELLYQERANFCIFEHKEKVISRIVLPA